MEPAINSVTSNVIVPINIDEEIQKRKVITNDWNKRFSDEKNSLVQAFANKIFTQIHNAMQNTVCNPLYSLFSFTEPLCQSYSFKIQNLNSLLKESIVKESLIAEWIHSFSQPEEQTNEKVIEFKASRLEKENGLLKRNYKACNQYMAQLGLEVEQTLNKKLEELSKLEGNNSLNFNVAFTNLQDHERGSTSSFSKGSYTSNLLIVKIWFAFDERVSKGKEKKSSGFLNSLLGSSTK